MLAERWAWGLAQAGIAPVLVAALCLAPLLPVGRFGKSRCMHCGYDLAGLPAEAGIDGVHRCPECGDHPSLGPPPAGEPAQLPVAAAHNAMAGGQNSFEGVQKRNPGAPERVWGVQK